MNTKKILIISIIALTILIIGMLVYNWLTQEEPAVTPTAEEEKIPKFPEAEEREIPEKKDEAEEKAEEEKIEALKALAEEKIIGAVLKEGKIKYLDQEEGSVWQSLPDGTDTTQISLGAVGDLEKVSWSRNGDRALIVSRDPETKKEQFYSYDQASGKTWTLDKHITAAVWHPEQDKIIFKYTDPELRRGSISISDPDGTNHREILPYAIKAELAPVPKKNKVAFYPKPSAYQESSIDSISLDGGKPVHTVGDYYGLNVLYSPEGNIALISYTVYRAGTDTNLALIEEGKSEMKRLNISTIVEKCVWAGDNVTLFCAAPAPLRDEVVMPDDWYAKRVSTRDTFWKIDTATGEKTKLAGAEEFPVSYDAANLILSEEEGKLFFTNRRDGKLYSIDI